MSRACRRGQYRYRVRGGTVVFFGEFKTFDNKNAIMLTNVGSTKKLCSDMRTEDAIFSAFFQVSSVNYDNNIMQLKDASGKVVMELSPIK